MKRTSFFALLLLASVLAAAGAAPDMRAASPALAATSSAPATLPTFSNAPPGARITPEGWFAPIPRDVVPPQLPEEIIRAFVIPIHGVISPVTADSVRRKVSRCRQSGAQIVIFDINSPGGRSDAMEDIMDLIATNMPGIYTVAYVNPHAYSAAAEISLSCNEMIMTPGGVMGDAMPIMLSPEGGLIPIPPEERGKFESAGKAKIRAIAQHNGYDSLMCEAMITLKLQLWLVRNDETRELRVVNAAEWQDKVRGVPSTIRSTSAPAVIESPWEYLYTVDGPDTLVTLTAPQAQKYGFCRNVIPTMAGLEKHYGIVQPPTVLADTWSEGLVDFLTSQAVTSVLMLIGVLGIYLEFQTPGHIVPGVVGGLCFAIVFGSRFLLGMSDWWPIALFALGIGLILLEVLVFTGHMVWGISGVLMCFVALGALFLPSTPEHLPALPSTPLDWSVFTDGLLSIGVAFVLGVIAMIVATSYLQRLPIAGKLVLPQLAISDKPPVMSTSPLLRIRAGDQGVVHSMCRPVGKVRFGNDIVDAASEGEVLTAGQKVRVLRNDGNRIIIEKI